MVRGQLAENVEDLAYSYRFVSGAMVLEVSGAVKLHNIVIGRATSGLNATVYDAAISGRYLSAGSVIVSVLNGGVALSTVTLEYDVPLNSGLVIVASGATWNMTVTYK